MSRRRADPRTTAGRRARLAGPRARANTPIVALAIAVVAAIALLVTASVLYLNDRDWSMVARVGDESINRAAVRDREAVLAFVYGEQAKFIDTLRLAGRMDDAEAARLSTSLDDALSDTRTRAIDDLVSAALVRRYARANAVATPSADVAGLLVSAQAALTDRRVAWTRLAWHPGRAGETPPASDELRRTGEELQAALAAGQDSTTVAATFEAAGWIVTGDTRWIAASGPNADLEPEAVAAIRSQVSGPVPPVVGTGWVVIANLVDRVDPETARVANLADLARQARIPDSALNAWAADQALASAVAAAQLETWRTTPAEAVRAAQVVIGPADPDGARGPWVELAHLVAGDVPDASLPAGSGAAADRILAELTPMDPAARRARFLELIHAAQATNPRSGELGYFVREQLAAAVGDAVFAEGVTTDSVVGPVVTDLGPELYLVEARYTGPLDERSMGALVELKTGGRTPADLATATSPDNAALALGGPWRSAAEALPKSAAYRALFETPVGSLSGPFTLGDRLVVAQVLERRTEIPDAAAGARLGVSGFTTWLAGEREPQA